MDKTERELREMLADRRLLRWPTEAQWNAIWLAANAKGYVGGVSKAVHSVDPTLLDNDWIEMMNIGPTDAKMMWAEICVRRSVSPFVEVNAPYTESQKAESTFQRQYEDLTGKGWKIVKNGPEGIELRAPKEMSTFDKILIGVGVATLIVYGLGLLLIAFALVHHFIYKAPDTVYLTRPPAKQE